MDFISSMGMGSIGANPDVPSIDASTQMVITLIQVSLTTAVISGFLYVLREVYHRIWNRFMCSILI